MALEPFSDAFPDRFFNVGVAEQNMVGLATGLAESGYIPFIYSIATFASMRGYELIRNGPIAHRFPVRVIGVGGGYEYGSAGPTHHGLEDVGIMRLQPGLTVVTPADHRQARTALLETWDRPEPVYYRIGKDDRTEVPGLDGAFTLGRPELVQDGADILIITMGSLAADCVTAAVELEGHGVSCAVSVVSTLRPTDDEAIARQLERFPVVMTVEEHYVEGGLGGWVASVIAGEGLRCRLIIRGVHDRDDGRSGSPAYYRRRHGLSKDAIVAEARRAAADAS